MRLNNCGSESSETSLTLTQNGEFSTEQEELVLLKKLLRKKLLTKQQRRQPRLRPRKLLKLRPKLRPKLQPKKLHKKPQKLLPRSLRKPPKRPLRIPTKKSSMGEAPQEDGAREALQEPHHFSCQSLKSSSLRQLVVVPCLQAGVFSFQGK